jgi:hypothetical protein
MIAPREHALTEKHGQHFPSLQKMMPIQWSNVLGEENVIVFQENVNVKLITMEWLVNELFALMIVPVVVCASRRKHLQLKPELFMTPRGMLKNKSVASVTWVTVVQTAQERNVHQEMM